VHVALPAVGGLAGDPVDTGREAVCNQLFGEFVMYLGTPVGVVYLALNVGLILLATVFWASDGWPGLSMDR